MGDNKYPMYGFNSPQGGHPQQPGAPPNYYPGGPPPPYGVTVQLSYPGAQQTSYPAGYPPPPNYPGVPHTSFPSAPPPSYPGGTHFAPIGTTHFTPSHSQPHTQMYPAPTVVNNSANGQTIFSSAATVLSQAGNVITGGSGGSKWVHWRAGSILPHNAVEGGRDLDGSVIYVGRFNHNGDLIPAKVIPSKRVAYVPYAGREISSSSCEILCQPHISWVHQANGNVPARAVIAGHTSKGEQLYVGRVHHKGSVTVGKVHPNHGVCYIPWDGKEVSHNNYEVLTY